MGSLFIYFSGVKLPKRKKDHGHNGTRNTTTESRREAAGSNFSSNPDLEFFDKTTVCLLSFFLPKIGWGKKKRRNIPKAAPGPKRRWWSSPLQREFSARSAESWCGVFVRQSLSCESVGGFLGIPMESMLGKMMGRCILCGTNRFFQGTKSFQNNHGGQHLSRGRWKFMEHFIIELGFAKLNGSFWEDGDGDLIAKGGLPKCWNFQVAHRKKRRVAANWSSAYHLIIISFSWIHWLLSVCFRADFSHMSRWMKLMRIERIGFLIAGVGSAHWPKTHIESKDPCLAPERDERFWPKTPAIWSYNVTLLYARQLYVRCHHTSSQP